MNPGTGGVIQAKHAGKTSLKVRDLSPKKRSPKGGASIDAEMKETGQKADIRRGG